MKLEYFVEIYQTDSLSRFLSPAVAEKYGLDIPPYEGIDQFVEVPVNKE